MDNQLLDSDLLNSKEGKSLNDILLYGYETNSIGYIKRGYEIFQQNAGAFIGFTIISFFLRIIGAFIPFASLALIPLGFGINIIAKKIDKEANRYIQQWPAEKISIENGRWGPFIRFGKKMMKLLPKDGKGGKYTPEELATIDVETVKKMITEQDPTAFAKKVPAKKGAAKKAAPKKASKKK